LVLCAAITSSAAQTNPWGAVVRPQAGHAGTAQGLTERQVQLVRQVNAYFNKLTLLQGSFVQTSANGKREKGVFHLMRPGRFRFDFAPPNRVVIISDGKSLSIQDYSMNTDDRRPLEQTVFRPLLRQEVDLLRDARIFDVSESGDTVTVGFGDPGGEAGSVRLFLGVKPVVQLKGWITRDNQNLDTRIDLAELQAVGSIDPRLFDPSSKLERRGW
jgi:outer membrane lipoprotein-sorting protein